MRKCADLTGQRFGRLIVVKRIGSKKNKALWLCKCDCGNEVKVDTAGLKTGHTKSCGCLHRDILIKGNKKRICYNTYDLNGKYGVGYFNTDNKPFYFDLEDYDKISNYTWHYSNGYAIAHQYKGDKRTTFKMHRLIMNVLDVDCVVDHINHNRLDNRKCNLRIANNIKNSFNHSIQSNNTSGVTGVIFHKASNKWCSRITVNGKRIILGYYDNFDEAVKVRKAAEEKYYGEWSYDNSMKLSERYKIV